MTEEELVDARLASLFADPAAAPDEAFVARIQRATVIEQGIVSMRRAQWRRFAVEALASATVAAVFLMLGGMGPLTLQLGEAALSPAVTASLILVIWFLVELRPAALER